MKRMKVLSLVLSSLVLFSCVSAPALKQSSPEEALPETPGTEERLPLKRPMELMGDLESGPSRKKPAETPPVVEEKEEPLTYVKLEKELYMKITGNLRKGPGLQYEILRVIYEDEKIETKAKASNGWYKVQYRGQEGYLSGILLTSMKPQERAQGSTGDVKEPVETAVESKPVDTPQVEKPEEQKDTADLPLEKAQDTLEASQGGETSSSMKPEEKPLADNEVLLPDAILKHQREVRHMGLRVNATEVPDDSHPYGTILEMVSKPGIYKKGETIEIKIAVASDKKAYFTKVDRALQQKYKFVVHKNLEEEILLLLNTYRKENGLKELLLKEDLRGSARYKSESMLQYDYFAHYNPYLEYISFGDLMNFVFEYTHYTKKGENLFANMGSEAVSAKVIFEGWKNSPSHNKAMLDPEYTFVGVGVLTAPVSGPFYGGKYVTLATQHFGK